MTTKCTIILSQKRRHPYFVRVVQADDQQDIDLVGANDFPHARKMAKALGYDATHWMRITQQNATAF